MKNLFIAAGMAVLLVLAHMAPALVPNWLGFILLVGFLLSLPVVAYKLLMKVLG